MAINPFELEIFQNMLGSIAEEMGMVLVRAAYSPNIKERRDLSCGIFDATGEMVAQAAHIPVHLGSMGFAVRSVLGSFEIGPGDVLIVNDPFKGGTHLPDVTCILPVFIDGVLEFFAAARAHHADMGGKTPGSMPLATSIHEEGIVIPPSKLYEGGRMNEGLFEWIVSSTRDPIEREGDFRATLAALELGERRMRELCGKYTTDRVKLAASDLLDYSERLMRGVIADIPAGTYSFTDYLEDDGAGTVDIPITATVTIGKDDATVDFSASSPQVRGCVNAPLSVTTAAVLYVFQCLGPEGMPLNSGPLRAIHIEAPEGLVVNATYPAAVSAGNCETSQRVVDVVMGALSGAIPEKLQAASAGTMNNVTFGGRTAEGAWAYAYYETIAGGAGGAKGCMGTSGRHTHMTNTLNTPVEALERELPIRIEDYSIRRGSGGEGRYPGGDGLVRSFHFLSEAVVTLITERRRLSPWGLEGGGDGHPGRNTLIRDGAAGELPAKVSLDVLPGDVLRIETPGGGGWGEP